MNKKGVVFTVIAVILLSVILLAFLINIENRSKIEIRETSVKVETVNNFVNTLNNQYFPLALKTSANQVILALLNYSQDNQAFLTQDQDINSIFREALINGKYIDGSNLDVMYLGGSDYTLRGTTGTGISTTPVSGCTGTPSTTSCNTFQSSTSCGFVKECSWITRFSRCGGTISACELQISQTACNLVPGCTLTHLECVNNACVLVEGAGTDECSSDNECLENQPPSVSIGKGTLGEIEDLAAETGIILSILDTDIDENSISITQEDAWNLNVSLKLNYAVTDISGDVNWNVQSKEVSILLDVEDYRDPVYLVKEGLNITIKKWDGLDFNSMVYSAKFNGNTDAPDFLQRLQGSLASSSTYGIETMLDPYSDLHPEDYSNADHHYWTNIPGQCTVVGFPSNFRLKDQAHLDLYSLEGYCG